MSRKRLLIVYLNVFSAGYILHVWWNTGLVFVKALSLILSVLFVVLIGMIVFPRRSNDREAHVANPSIFLRTLLAVFIFFVPIIGREHTVMVTKILTEYRSSIAWFEQGNPFGFSKELIRFIRSMPPQQTFLVDPLGNAALSLYAPQYAAVPPQVLGKTIMNAHDAYREALSGGHPLFRPPDGTGGVNHEAVLRRLNQYSAGYILVQRDHYDRLLPYFRRFAEDYDIVFQNPEHGELVVRYRHGSSVQWRGIGAPSQRYPVPLRKFT